MIESTFVSSTQIERLNTEAFEELSAKLDIIHALFFFPFFLFLSDNLFDLDSAETAWISDVDLIGWTASVRRRRSLEFDW